MTDPAHAEPPRRSPFGFLRPAVSVAGVYGLATIVWLALGDALPGGRWLAVHLFTLGVVTNLIVALTRHFAQTLMHAPAGEASPWRLVLLNAGVLGVAFGWPGMPALLAAGSIAVVVAIAWLYVDLRRMRKRSLSGRFAFVVRGYERACGAFFHGATLGALLGVGVIGGAWYGALRTAHLHVNVLGWAGLTLLATVVFFGPTMLRTRMVAGADASAAKALRHGTTGLTVATAALVLTGFGGGPGTGFRLLAAAGLAVYAVAATSICVHVLRAGRGSARFPQGLMIQAACAWFVVLIWADVAVVATGQLRLLDALGAGVLVAVLAQAILAALNYLAPMVWAAGPAQRSAARTRLDRLPWPRAAVLNLGALLVVAAVVSRPAAGDVATYLARSGWALVAVAALIQLALLAREAAPALAARVTGP